MNPKEYTITDVCGDDKFTYTLEEFQKAEFNITKYTCEPERRWQDLLSLPNTEQMDEKTLVWFITKSDSFNYYKEETLKLRYHKNVDDQVSKL